MIYVIAIGHKARQGKTTFGLFLEAGFRDFGAITATVSFADALKSHYRLTSGIYTIVDKKPLQAYSDELKNIYGESCFARDVIGRIEENYASHVAAMDEEPDVVYIIPDLRFKNELAHLKAAFPNVVTIKVVREDFVDDTRDPNHNSEVDFDGDTEWADYEVTARNLDDLKGSAGFIVMDLLGLHGDGEDTPSESIH